MFKRKRGEIVLSLESYEVEVLDQLFDQMIELVEVEHMPVEDPLERLVGLNGPSIKPSDPALGRLFPDGYHDDIEAAADFRRYTEHEMRNNKAMKARISQSLLHEWPGKRELTPDQANAWLLSLNDMRLALGTRLEITDDKADRDDDNAPGYELYDWLTYVQGTLVDALTNK